jgi:hypothetical protein
MTLTWQDYIAIVVVLAAAAYLGGKFFTAVLPGKSSGCGSGCGKCSAGDLEQSRDSDATQLVVTIGTVRRQP